jgi:hypothetical protein
MVITSHFPRAVFRTQVNPVHRFKLSLRDLTNLNEGATLSLS